MNPEWHLHWDTGKHLEAWNNQGKLYKDVIDQRSLTNPRLEILDFGCGKNASSRRHLQSLIRSTSHRLSLYDEDYVREPRQENVRIVCAEDVIGENSQKFDIVNISYVFCLMKDADARKVLQQLIKQNPKMSFVVIDYILRGRDNNEVLRLLNAEEEKRWLGMLGEEKFCEVHAHFDRESLLQLCQESGLTIEKSETLDTADIRLGLIGSPKKSQTVSTEDSSKFVLAQT